MNVFFALKGYKLFIHYFLSLQLDVVPYGGHKSLPHSSIVQIIFYFWSFEIMEYILRTRKLSYVKIHFLNKSKRKAMNRNWCNQKANPALNTKAGNK